jgi:uncharacterized protein YacL
VTLTGDSLAGGRLALGAQERPLRRSVFIEIVRLLVVLVSAAAGLRLASATTAPLAGVVWACVIWGACVGYVGGGLLGRSLLRGMGAIEEHTEQASAGEVLAGAVGALLTGAIAALVGVSAIGLLPGGWGWPVFSLIVWIGVYAGFQIASRKSADLLAMAGLSEGTAGGALPARAGDAVLLDTSVLMDGRLLKVARSGFLHRDLLLPRFILDELQQFADSGDATMRRKGRRGIEALDVIRSDGLLRVHVPDDELPELETVDAKLVALATRLSVPIMTNDQALASVAEIRGVRCLNLQRLANSFVAVRVPGEALSLSIRKEGRRPGEGVGFLDDGSMVVVPDASHLLGQEVQVRISSSAQTPGGRMFFASLAES